MERLTKTYDDGTHAAADNLPCGENSWNYKELLLNKLGAYEDTGLRPCEILVLSDKLKYASEQWDIWCAAYQKDVPVWIPVGERLPETEIEVLAQWEKTIRQTNEVYTYLDVLGIDSRGRWYGDHGMPTGRVVAWMPLPEPYRPE